MPVFISGSYESIRVENIFEFSSFKFLSQVANVDICLRFDFIALTLTVSELDASERCPDTHTCALTYRMTALRWSILQVRIWTRLYYIFTTPPLINYCVLLLKIYLHQIIVYFFSPSLSSRPSSLSLRGILSRTFLTKRSLLDAARPRFIRNEHIGTYVLCGNLDACDGRWDRAGCCMAGKTMVRCWDTR